jgi:nitrite reductase (NADH) small subunit
LPPSRRPLSQGIVHGAQVTCPLHNWVFSLETGEAQGADEGRVRTIALKLDGETILMDADLAIAIAAE